MPFMAFVSDEANLKVLREFSKGRGWDSAHIHQGDIHAAAKFLKENPTPQVLVVEIATQAEAAGALDALADVCSPGVKVIVTGTINEYSFYCWLTDIGISGYLLKPLTVAAIDAAVAKASEPPAAAAAEAKPQACAVIGIVGTRGGVGGTTIATNLAWLLAEKYKQATAFVDLDPQFGTGALAFDLEPGRGFRDVLEKPDRIDSLFMDRVLVKYSDHLAILGTEESMEENIQYHPESASLLISEMRQKFSFVVLDVEHELNAFTKQVLRLCDTLMIVTELSIPGLRDTLRLKEMFKDLKSESLMFIASKAGLAGKHEMSRADFEKALDAKLAYAVPFAADAFAAAAEGKPLAEAHKSSPIVSTIDSIARMLMPEGQAAAGKKKAGGGLLGLLKKKS